MTKRFLSSVFLFSAVAATAQQKDTLQNDLDPVVVTATKSAIKQSQTGKVVTVIDRATIERNIDKTVSEILNYQTGIFINGANNAPGTNQDVYFRGAATGKVLIMIDGVPVIDASQINNSFDLNSINTSQVDHIEILKGAQSTLWGSDAVAGVINIITKKGGTKAFSPDFLASYGSYNTFKGSAGINGKVSGFTYNLSYNRVTSKGFSAAYDTTGKAGYDKDKFSQNNFQANLGYQVTKRLAVTTLIQAGKYTNALDKGAFQDAKDYNGNNKNYLYNLGFKYEGGPLSIHLASTLQRSKRGLLNPSSAPGQVGYENDYYNAKTLITDLYGNYRFSEKASLLVGGQHIYQNTDQGILAIYPDFTYKSALGADSAKIHSYSGYASFLLTGLGGFNNEVGIRINHHNIYGNNATFTFNPSFNVDDNTRLFLNVSSAFKVPTIYQLFSEYGNKNLKPEKSMNYELGVQLFGNDRKNSFRVLAFKRDIKNLIVFYTDPSYNSYYINRDKQNDYGFEMESSIALAKVGNWLNNFTYVDGEGENDNVKIRNLYRRPNFTFNSTLNLEPVAGLTVSPAFRFVGTRSKGQYDPGPDVMPQYYTVDLSAAYRFTKGVRVFTDFRNITNQQYFDVPGYTSRRFNFTAGVAATF